MNKLEFASAVLLGVSLPLFLVVASFASLLYDQSYYQRQFAAVGTYFRVPDADSINQGVLGFLSGKSDLPSEFSPRESQHMQDVKRFISALWLFGLVAAVIFSLSFFFLARRSLRKALLAISIGCASLLAVFVLVWRLPGVFWHLFGAFHEIFFQPGSYVFDESDLLIRLYPPAFFANFSMSICIWAGLAALILLAVSLFRLSRLRKIKSG